MSSAAKGQTIPNGVDITIFDSTTDGSGVTKFFIGCPPDSPFGIQINIPGLHKTGEYFPIYIGGSEIFTSPQGFTTIVARGDGGNAVADWGVVEASSLFALLNQIKTKTDQMRFTIPNIIDAGVVGTNISPSTPLIQVDIPEIMIRPKSGSMDYTIELKSLDNNGNPVDCDILPSISARNSARIDYSNKLSDINMPKTGTGEYQVTYNVASTDDEEEVFFDITARVSGNIYEYGRSVKVADPSRVLRSTIISD